MTTLTLSFSNRQLINILLKTKEDISLRIIKRGNVRGKTSEIIISLSNIGKYGLGFPYFVLMFHKMKSFSFKGFL